MSNPIQISLSDYRAIYESMESAANMLSFLAEVFDSYGSDGFKLEPSAASGLVTFLDMALKQIESGLENAPSPYFMGKEAADD